jgi:hypothetical protein
MSRGNTVPKNDREHFIPFRRSDLIEACLEGSDLAKGEREAFRDFARILESIVHFEFHRRLERLKECFAPGNPDADTRPLKNYSADASDELQREFVLAMKSLLDAANYQPITREDLEQAFEEASLFKVRLSVEFDDFEDVLFFRRGEHRRRETVPRLWRFFPHEIEFTNYDRVAVYVRFKDASYFEGQGRDDLRFQPGSSVIKLFRDVPKADLEMLFPNTQVAMRTLDKLVIGVPAAASGVSVLVTKLGSTLVLVAALAAFWLGLRPKTVTLDQPALLALGAGLAALGGFLWRQLTKFKNRKIAFMKTLADSLYFKNLDNGAGVFHRLIDAAEEEEMKEMLLAYHFLLQTGRPMRQVELDADVERWFRDTLGCELDFEIADALEKLSDFGLATSEGEAFRALPLDAARQKLDARWDAYFDFRASI